MYSRPAAALGLFWFVLGASAVWAARGGGDPVASQLDALDKAYSKSSGKELAGLSRLKELRESLAAAKDPDPIIAEYTQLAKDLRAELSTMQELREQYQKALAVPRAKSLRTVLQDRRGRKSAGFVADTGAMLAAAMGYEERMGKIYDSSMGIEKAINREDELFTAARAQAVERHGWRTILIERVAAAAAFLLVLFVLGRGWLRRQFLEPLPTGPGSTVPLVPVGPASGPASGPGPGAAVELVPRPGMPAKLDENYEIVRMIGKGGMGEVYEAFDASLARKVAVKRMREELVSDPRELEKFLNEARLVASLKHPNIVSIYSIVREGGQVFLVFELVPGWTLFKVLARHTRLSPKQAKYVLRCMASALDYAHSRRVVHRDLKPANVMVTPENQIRIMDFGIAYQAKQTIARLTRAEAWGTAPYMSPEQELGRVSKDVDVYALAVCFYEMLTGTLPFPGPNYLAQKEQELFKPASSLAADVPPSLDKVFAKAFSAQVARRYRSAGELLEAVGSAS